MTSAKSLATRFYQPKCGHALVGAYLNDSDTERMTIAGGAGEWWAIHGSISSITAAGGNTSSGSSAKAGAECRVPVRSTPPRHEGRRGWWWQARPMGAVTYRPHARARQHRTLGSHRAKSLVNTKRVVSGKWQVASGKG